MAGVEYPQNDFTRMIEDAARLNASGVRQPSLASATPGPSVTTPAMREPTPIEETPLTAEERADLDRRAIAAGVVDPRLGNAPGQVDHGPVDAASDKYAGMSMEQIIAEGTSVHAAAPVVTRQGAPVMVSRVANPRQQSPSFAPAAPQSPRLPNFRNVQDIDLILGVVYVDDMSFEIAAEELAEFRRYAVEVARAEIMKRLDEALSLVTQATAEATDVEGGNEAKPQG